jgi:hypothetical protein
LDHRRILVLDDDCAVLREAIERMTQREAISDLRRMEVPMLIQFVPEPKMRCDLPELLPLPPEPKVGKVFHAGRFGQMPIPNGKRKKFKPSRQQRRK